MDSCEKNLILLNKKAKIAFRLLAFLAAYLIFDTVNF